jgi:NuA3 HAT complex component NTO1
MTPFSVLPNPLTDDSLDGKGVFNDGLQRIRSKLDARCYTSVAPFSSDLGMSFGHVIGLSPSTSQEAEPNAQLTGIVSAAVESSEQKEKKKLATRIIRAIQPSLEEATRKAAELSGRPFEKELLQLDALLVHHPVFSPRGSLTASLDDTSSPDGEAHAHPHGIITANGHGSADTPLSDAPAPATKASGSAYPPTTHGTRLPSGTDMPTTHGVSAAAPAPSQGGVPWYMQEFDPEGTNVFEERWTGREAMSEELSSMDEEDVRDLGGDIEMVGADDVAVVVEPEAEVADGGAAKGVEKKKKQQKKKKKRVKRQR